jgi:hypothetical protein
MAPNLLIVVQIGLVVMGVETMMIKTMMSLVLILV